MPLKTDLPEEDICSAHSLKGCPLTKMKVWFNATVCAAPEKDSKPTVQSVSLVSHITANGSFISKKIKSLFPLFPHLFAMK